MYQISGHYAKQNEPKDGCYMVSLILETITSVMRRPGSIPGQEDQMEKGMATHPV